MEIRKKLFSISFPIEIFKRQKVNFSQKNFRNTLFKRNIYYHIYGTKLNPLLIKRSKIFYNLALKVKEQMEKNKFNVLSVSVFGSSLYSTKNNDYDFLVIVNGNEFNHLKMKVKLNNQNYPVEISIKGKDNFTKGILSNNLSFSKELQNKIINRTSISLPFRHIPLWGFDFKENKKLFIENCCAQTYDLLINTYELYYLKNKNKKLSDKKRSQKILSRIFEASKYLSFISPSKDLEKIKEEIFNKRMNDVNLKESKRVFEKFVNYYNKFV